MAGDWIKMRGCLPDEPEVIAIAAATGIEEDAVVGKLLRLWFWGDQHTTDGCAPGVSRKWIDRFLSAPGFSDALIGVGWMATTTDGVSLPKFDKHNTETGKQRALASRRSVTQKMRKRCAKGNGAGATPSSLLLCVSSSSLSLLGSMDCAKVRESLDKWIQYKRERGKGYKKPWHLQSLIDRYANRPDDLVNDIGHSISQNYDGVHPEKRSGAKPTSRPGLFYDPEAKGGLRG